MGPPSGPRSGLEPIPHPEELAIPSRVAPIVSITNQSAAAPVDGRREEPAEMVGNPGE
jgi:hypothetical protein